MGTRQGGQGRGQQSGRGTKPLATHPPHQGDQQAARDQPWQQGGDAGGSEQRDRQLDQGRDQRRGIQVPGGVGIVTLEPEPDIGGVNPLIEVRQGHLRHSPAAQRDPQQGDHHRQAHFARGERERSPGERNRSSRRRSHGGARETTRHERSRTRRIPNSRFVSALRDRSLRDWSLCDWSLCDWPLCDWPLCDWSLGDGQTAVPSPHTAGNRLSPDPGVVAQVRVALEHALVGGGGGG